MMDILEDELTLTEDVGLDRTNQDKNPILSSLNNFEAPYLEEKLLSDSVFKTKEEYQEAFSEFKKFVGLVALYDKKLSMTSKKVDAVWHQFILFTPQYHEFCNKFLGKYLHHIPRTSFTPLSPNGKRNFIELYKTTFNDIPDIWNIASNNAECTDYPACAPSGYCAPACDD